MSALGVPPAACFRWGSDTPRTFAARPRGRLCGMLRGFLRCTVPALLLPQAALDGLSEFGARGELHLKRRSFARRRYHPDAPAVHLDDLLGDGEAEARAALGLGKRAVDLVELLEDPTLLVERYAGPGVGHRDGEMAVPRACGDAHLAGIGKLDGVTDEVEQHLREALFVAEANRERLVHGRLERELLVLGERLGGTGSATVLSPV